MRSGAKILDLFGSTVRVALSFGVLSNFSEVVEDDLFPNTRFGERV